jgi:Uma2 family endonuclease
MEAIMTLLTKKFYTPAEYFKFEEQSETKHEYRDGRIVPMAGASSNHILVASNVLSALDQRLQHTPCLIYTNDMRVLVKPQNIYTYPDVTVVCDKPEFVKGRNDTISNPTVIVEVLSPSTRAYDRGRKSDLYRALKSLQAYILIEPDYAHIDYYWRQADGSWELTEHNQLNQTLTIQALRVTIPLTKIYNKVDWVSPPIKRSKKP